MFTKEEKGNTFSLAMDNHQIPNTGYKLFRKPESNNLVVQDMPVFRSGTFRNSWGEQSTYSDLHIQQMVTNFDYLKSARIFEDVPVRKAHPEPWFRNSTEEVIGYVTSLRVEKRPHPATGVEYSYLIAEYEIFDDDAATKIEKRLFRNRSAEVGVYLDNDEAEYYPVLMGFAYVDIPAVEGLNFGKHAKVRLFALDNQEGNSMDEEEVSAEETPVEDETPTEETPVEDETPTEETPVEEVSDENETPVEEFVTETGSVSASINTAEPVEDSDPALGSPIVSVDTDSHSGNFAKAQVFTINGKQVSDPAVVQRFIDELYGAVAVSRDDFISHLFSANKISSGQMEPLKQFAASLTIEQWDQFRTIMEDSPTNPTLDFRQNPADKPEAKENDVETQVSKHLLLALGKEGYQRTRFAQTQNTNKDGI